MPSKVPCIAAIVKASKDRLTNRAAGEMLRNLGDLTEMRSKNKRISLDAAAAEIHAEAIQRENLRASRLEPGDTQNIGTFANRGGPRPGDAPRPR